MNSNMVRLEKFDHLHLVYHFTVPLSVPVLWISFKFYLIFFKMNFYKILIFFYIKIETMDHVITLFTSYLGFIFNV